MKPREIPLPASAEERAKVLRKCEIKCNTCSVFFFIFLALAVAGFLGAVVSVLVLELNRDVSQTLCGILIGAFFGGSVVAGGLAAILSRVIARVAFALNALFVPSPVVGKLYRISGANCPPSIAASMEL